MIIHKFLVLMEQLAFDLIPDASQVAWLIGSVISIFIK